MLRIAEAEHIVARGRIWTWLAPGSRRDDSRGISRSAAQITRCAPVCGRSRQWHRRPCTQLQPRTRCNNRARSRHGVIYPSHPERGASRERDPVGDQHSTEARGPIPVFFRRPTPFPRRCAAHLYHRTPVAELRGETAYRRCRCRGTDRIGLLCAARDVIYDR